MAPARSITRSLNDINVIQQAILQTIQLVLPVPFLAVAGIIFAWHIDPAMGTLLGAVVAIVLVAAVFTVANAAPIFMRLQSFIDRMNVVLRENIVGVRVIRAFNKERHEEQRLDEVFSDYAANAIKVNHLFVGLDSSCFFLMNIAEVAVLWVGGNRVGVHAMQIGSISAMLEYALLILFFVMMAQMVILTLPRAAACLNRPQRCWRSSRASSTASECCDARTLSTQRTEQTRLPCSTICRSVLTTPTRTRCAT